MILYMGTLREHTYIYNYITLNYIYYIIIYIYNMYLFLHIHTTAGIEGHQISGISVSAPKYSTTTICM